MWNTTDYYYHQNALWSVIAVTDALANVVERYAYTDYGCPTITDGASVTVPPNAWGTAHSAIGNPYLFTGRRWDEESGLYYYRARYYDCEAGRFLQRDPLGYVDGSNLYWYTRDNPVNRWDPSGQIDPGTVVVVGKVLWKVLVVATTLYTTKDMVEAAINESSTPTEFDYVEADGAKSGTWKPKKQQVVGITSLTMSLPGKRRIPESSSHGSWQFYVDVDVAVTRDCEVAGPDPMQSSIEITPFYKKKGGWIRNVAGSLNFKIGKGGGGSWSGFQWIDGSQMNSGGVLTIQAEITSNRTTNKWMGESDEFTWRSGETKPYLKLDFDYW